AKPTAMPEAVPSAQPATMRTNDAETCCHSAPLAASRYNARMIIAGVGRNNGLTSARPPTNCQTTSTAASPSQPAQRLAAGVKPAPRNGTCRAGCTPAVSVGSFEVRSSMLNLALGIDRLVPDQH